MRLLYVSCLGIPRVINHYSFFFFCEVARIILRVSRNVAEIWKQTTSLSFNALEGDGFQQGKY
jgi:hypothetical protein